MRVPHQNFQSSWYTLLSQTYKIFTYSVEKHWPKCQPLLPSHSFPQESALKSHLSCKPSVSSIWWGPPHPHPQLSEPLHEPGARHLVHYFPSSSSCSHPPWGSLSIALFLAWLWSSCELLDFLRSAHPIFAKKTFTELTTLPLTTFQFKF